MIRRLSSRIVNLKAIFFIVILTYRFLTVVTIVTILTNVVLFLVSTPLALHNAIR